MFYDSNQVDNELLCIECQGRLEIPKILPCGETICSFCESTIQINDNKFDCLICKEKHDMPNRGLPTNKVVSKMLAIKPTEVSRGEAFDTLQQSLDDLKKKRNLIKRGIESSNDLLKEHCMGLRNDVQLKAEEVILQVNDFRS